MTSEEIMAEAIEMGLEAVTNPDYRPFAALVVKDGEIIGRGLNSTVSHDPTAHGEILAIRDAAERLGTADLSGCEIYTTCEPCPMCVGAIWWAKLDRIYYAATLKDCENIGLDLGELVEEVAKPLNERALKSEQILGKESWAVFEQWSKSPGFGVAPLPGSYD